MTAPPIPRARSYTVPAPSRLRLPSLTRTLPDRRRALQLALGMIWLLDAALQYQPYMFTKGFVSQVVQNSASGSPAVVADPIMAGSGAAATQFDGPGGTYAATLSSATSVGELVRSFGFDASISAGPGSDEVAVDSNAGTVALGAASGEQPSASATVQIGRNTGNGGLVSAVLTGEPAAGYAVDWTGRFRGQAAAVVRPANTEQVAAVLACCTQAGLAVVPQGGNTGLVGGGVPLHGEVVLSLRRLTQLSPVDLDARQVTAGAGVTLAEVGQDQRVVGEDLRRAHPSRPGPADDLAGQRPARLEPALDGGQQRLVVAEVPAEEPAAALLADPQSLGR